MSRVSLGHGRHRDTLTLRRSQALLHPTTDPSEVLPTWYSPRRQDTIHRKELDSGFSRSL